MTDAHQVWDDYVAQWGGGGGAPTDADYIVGSAQAGLSAEVLLSTVIGKGTLASRPAAGAVPVGSTYYITDSGSQRWTRSTGAAWEDCPPEWSQILGKPTTFAPIIGGGAGDAVAGNDARLTDARAPTAHKASHQHSGSDEVATATAAANAIPKADGSGKLDTWVSDASATVKGKVELATDGEATAGLAVQGDDARLANARTPTAHKDTHKVGGSDPFVAGDDLVGVARGLRETGGPTALTAGAIVDGEVLKRVGSTIVSVAPGAPGAHASTHQNGGADEVNVAGLSGELADPQPPKIAALPAVTTPAATDIFPVDQAGTLKNETLAQIVDYIIKRAAAATMAAGAYITQLVLAANSSDITGLTLTTVMAITGLPAGRYHFKCQLIYQTTATTTGKGVAVNFTGTLTQFIAELRQATTGGSAATNAATMVGAAATGNLYEAQATRTKNTLIGAVSVSVDAANTDMMCTIEGFFVVSVSGDLEIKLEAELASLVVRAVQGSFLELTRLS